LQKHLADDKEAEGDEQLSGIVRKTASDCNRKTPALQDLGNLGDKGGWRPGVVDCGICS